MADDKEEEYGYLVKTTEVHRCIYKIYLNNSIEEFDKYTRLLPVFDNAKVNDHIVLTMQNYGGSCHSCLSLCNSITDSKAKVECRVIGPCYSAGTTIALSCDSIVMYPHSLLMFHDYSTELSGKSSEIKADIKHHDKWIHGYMEDYHIPFLTKKEHKEILNGKDLYIHWSDKDLQKRIDRHFK